MIIPVTSPDDCLICDNFLTMLIQDERQYDDSIDPNFVVQDYFVNMLNNDNILLIYKDKGLSLGYAFGRKMNNDYLIDGLFVAKEYRQKGIATALVKDLIKRIQSKGDFSILINVVKANTKAYNLYQTLGFTIQSANRHKYTMIYDGNND